MMIFLNVVGISQDVFADENDPSPIVVLKGDPTPEDGFWVSFMHYNIIVSGAERLEKDVEAYKKALDNCITNGNCQEEPSTFIDKLIWGSIGASAGSVLTLVLVIVLL